VDFPAMFEHSGTKVSSIHDRLEKQNNWAPNMEGFLLIFPSDSWNSATWDMNETVTPSGAKLQNSVIYPPIKMKREIPSQSPEPRFHIHSYAVLIKKDSTKYCLVIKLDNRKSSICRYCPIKPSI